MIGFVKSLFKDKRVKHKYSNNTEWTVVDEYEEYVMNKLSRLELISVQVKIHESELGFVIAEADLEEVLPYDSIITVAEPWAAVGASDDDWSKCKLLGTSFVNEMVRIHNERIKNEQRT